MTRNVFSFLHNGIKEVGDSIAEVCDPLCAIVNNAGYWGLVFY